MTSAEAIWKALVIVGVFAFIALVVEVLLLSCGVEVDPDPWVAITFVALTLAIKAGGSNP